MGRRRGQQRKKKLEERTGPSQPIGNTVTGDLGPEQLVAIPRSPETNLKQQVDFARLVAAKRLAERF